MTVQQRELVMHGLPTVRELDAACRAQLAALGRHWRLVSGVKPGAGALTEAAPLPPLERLYRVLDMRLFGRGPWKINGADADLPAVDVGATAQEQCHLAWCREVAADIDAECLCVEFEGLPMAQMGGAVRSRLGQRGGTLCARVWLLRAGAPPKLLMLGKLRLDHRSLHRSVAACAAKLPALIAAAFARRGRLLVVDDSGRASAPSPRAAGAELLRLVRSVLKRSLWRERWQIEVLSFDGALLSEAKVVSVIRPPNSAFWADPFLLRRGQRTWVLFEELVFATNRGRIAAIEIDASGQPISAPQIVLCEPWHLSYPFVWHDGERTYMIPEAGESGELRLYEAVGDGMQWERRATLISGQRLADATIVRYAGRLWMFATAADPGVATMEDTLHIYWADRIEGPWHAHALNPVKVDASSARPAGAMHVGDGELHRVVMDCSSTYGGSVRWMRVMRLTETEFEEEAAPGWLPKRDLEAEPWHTFNVVGNLAVTDRLVRLPRWRTR